MKTKVRALTGTLAECQERYNELEGKIEKFEFVTLNNGLVTLVYVAIVEEAVKVENILMLRSEAEHMLRHTEGFANYLGNHSFTQKEFDADIEKVINGKFYSPLPKYIIEFEVNGIVKYSRQNELTHVSQFINNTKQRGYKVIIARKYLSNNPI